MSKIWARGAETMTGIDAGLRVGRKLRHSFSTPCFPILLKFSARYTWLQGRSGKGFTTFTDDGPWRTVQQHEMNTLSDGRPSRPIADLGNKCVNKPVFAQPVSPLAVHQRHGDSMGGGLSLVLGLSIWSCEQHLVSFAVLPFR